MRLRSLLALLALLLPSVACDQATKALAVAHLKGQGRIQIIDSIFTLVYAENPGAFLGLGKSLPDTWRWAVFTVAVGVLLAGVAFFMLRKKLAPLAFAGVALLVAGGVGNLIDRIARPGGRVVDFAQLALPAGSIGGVRLQTGVFNVADVQIFAGAGMMLVSSWRRRKEPDADGDATPPAPPAGDAPAAQPS
jgi:signal peptidase II